MDIPYQAYKEWHIVYHSPSATEADKKRIEEESGGLIHAEVFDVSLAQYVVLPIIFKDDKPTIHWRERWSLDEFD